MHHGAVAGERTGDALGVDGGDGCGSSGGDLLRLHEDFNLGPRVIGVTADIFVHQHRCSTRVAVKSSARVISALCTKRMRQLYMQPQVNTCHWTSTAGQQEQWHLLKLWTTVDSRACPATQFKCKSGAWPQA